MKIDEKGIEALKWLLPEHGFGTVGDELIMDGCHVSVQTIADHLCGEIERAWLALKVEFEIYSPTKDHDYWQIDIRWWVVEPDDVYAEANCQTASTKLEAYIAATVVLKEG